MSRRVAVYLCHCGRNIAAHVDLAEVARRAGAEPGVVLVRDYPYLCSKPGQDLIRADLEAGRADRVVVAACSPRMHEPTFRRVLAEAGRNPHLLHHVNVREQCAWVHPDRAAATAKAADLVAAGAARVRRHEPLRASEAPVERRCLVVGGGPAGLAAADTLATAGVEVVLVEAADRLGGRAAELGRAFPGGGEVGPWLGELTGRVLGSPRTRVWLGSRVVAVEGVPGAFRARIETPEGPREETVGALVVATGYDLYRPDDPAEGRPELGYGAVPGVVTQAEFEEVLRRTEGPVAVGGRPVGRAVFVQCVGSRDRTAGAFHCSRVCCMVSVRQARDLRARNPEAGVEVLYMDLRAYARGAEEDYEAAGREGVVFRRGGVSEVFRRGNRAVVRWEDTLLGQAQETEADLVVLACGARPRADAGDVGRALGLARGPDGFFLEAHVKLRPVEAAAAGLFLAGACLGPRTLDEAVASGRAAAARALTLLLRGRMPLDPQVAVVDPDRCAGCGACEAVCPAGAVRPSGPSRVRRVEPGACRGCGACAAACPSHAVVLLHHRDDQILAELDACLAENRLAPGGPAVVE